MAMHLEAGSRPEPTPACAICAGPGEGARAELHLPFGVTVWLCAAHRSEEFQRRREGRDLSVSLSAVWQACGALTARRVRALEAHRAALLRAAGPRSARRPGSYTWQALRHEAEARWAAGEPVRPVIDELRGRHLDGSASVPSRTTMRRWFRERRWA